MEGFTNWYSSDSRVTVLWMAFLQKRNKSIWYYQSHTFSLLLEQGFTFGRSFQLHTINKTWFVHSGKSTIFPFRFISKIICWLKSYSGKSFSTEIMAFPGQQAFIQNIIQNHLEYSFPNFMPIWSNPGMLMLYMNV